MTTYTTSAMSGLNQAEFINALDGIFEHSPWVAEHAWHQRPFASRQALLDALLLAMWQAGHEQQRALILAHPELAGKAALRGELTEHSTQEQQGAGLNACSPEELAAIQQLNARYQEKFGMPFIIAVRGLGRQDIIARMAARLNNDMAAEWQENLTQIGNIARLRLEDRVTES